MTRRRLVLSGLPLLLASCGGILPQPAPPPSLYRLTPLSGAAPAGPVDAQLAIELPGAAESLDTARIALRRGAYGFDYFANAAWSDRTTALVQTLIVESLEPGVRVVTAPSGELRADALLISTLRRFEADYDGKGPPTVEVRLDCLLVRPADRTVLAVRSFAGNAPASANDVPEIVAAFDAALHAALAGMPSWIAASLGRGQP